MYCNAKCVWGEGWGLDLVAPETRKSALRPKWHYVTLTPSFGVFCFVLFCFVFWFGLVFGF